MANTKDGSLGDMVREARVRLDIGLRELARRIKVTPSYVSDIEHDRRVPSEEVLAALAAELNLRLDDLMAKAGRVGDRAERYLKQHPAAGVLFRRISERGLSESDLERLVKEAERLSRKKEK